MSRLKREPEIIFPMSCSAPTEKLCTHRDA
jgi:hypothetical protein